jgi:hypothetical protein
MCCPPRVSKRALPAVTEATSTGTQAGRRPQFVTRARCSCRLAEGSTQVLRWHHYFSAGGYHKWQCQPAAVMSHAPHAVRSVPLAAVHSAGRNMPATLPALIALLDSLYLPRGTWQVWRPLPGPSSTRPTALRTRWRWSPVRCQLPTYHSAMHVACAPRSTGSGSWRRPPPPATSRASWLNLGVA